MPISRRRLIAAAGAFAAPLGAARSVRAADAFTMRLSISDAATSLPGITALRFAAAVNRRANGQLKIEVYPNGQLAKQQETPDALANGVLDFSIQSTAFLVQMIPQFQVFDMPFLFKNIEANYRVLDGPIGNEFFAGLEQRGITGLAWGTTGFRQIQTTTRPIVTPDDLKGLRMRIQPGAVYAATFQALGAIPITIDLSEVFVALQQHVIEGLDGTIVIFNVSKLYTVAKHMAMTNHVPTLAPLLGSKKKIEALPQPLQKIVREEGKALVPFWRSLVARETASTIQTLKGNGVAFTDIQYSAFRKAVDPVYTMMQAKIGADLIDRVSRAAGA